METTLKNILNEAVKLELLMSKLYYLFQQKFPQDSNFWGKLSTEEKEHAQIILKYIPFLEIKIDDLHGFESASLSSLVLNNMQINEVINNFTDNNTREDAFRESIKLENSSSEENYRFLLNSDTDSEIISIFKTLNGEDRKHYKRIVEYVIKEKINIKE